MHTAWRRVGMRLQRPSCLGVRSDARCVEQQLRYMYVHAHTADASQRVIAPDSGPRKRAVLNRRACSLSLSPQSH